MHTAEPWPSDRLGGPCRPVGPGKRTKIKLSDRISALKLIGQQHGMFKSETTVNGGTPIPVVLSPAEQLL
jgi:hypothetical protein